MSHLHIPDGVLPPWLWLGGFVIFALILGLSFWRLKKEVFLVKKMPILAAITALMILGMSFPIVPIFYHLNLTVLAGIVLGPAAAVLAVFLSNLILAFFAHGGLTVIGLNSLILVFEAVFGWFLFKFVFRFISRSFLRGFLAALPTLIVSTFLAIGVVALGGADFRRFMEASVALGALGWILESSFTGFIVSYLKKIKPSILTSE
ncbi:MAG: energy-coupling factor ABC transporter permease [bacterium]|nr:energy-coupling factor ABC transporter permease [bacterium]